MTPVIRTEQLSKTYRAGFWMRPLDMEVQKGQIFGFIGPNGAGKTTTIKMLMGLQAATGGRGWLFDRPMEDPECRRRVGFLPERPYFYEHLTSRELLNFYGQLFDVPSAVRAERIPKLLERVDLSRFADVPLRKYSKGMLQRVGLCQALLHDPELVVLDEPMSGLDPDIIPEERAAGRTVFFSSHILSDVEALCDRVAIIVRGEARGIGTVSELIGDRVRYVECVFSGVPDLALGGEERPRSDGERLVRLQPELVDATVDAVRAAGGRILAINPVRESLEHVLLTEVERNRPVNHERLGVLS